MKVTTTSPCPICSGTMVFNWETQEIPHFGEAMLIAGSCTTCGFKHADTMLLAQNEPLRHSLLVQKVEDLNARVIRSSSGTISLPELGIDVEPGPASESYISNVEGVLQRIRDIVKFALKGARQAQDPDRISRGTEILAALDRVIEGEMSLTVTIEDPFGNSAIVSEDVVVSTLTGEEIDQLKTGMIVLDSPSN